MDNGVVTRIPPSPTGHLHIGTVRTALYNFLFARKNGGSFIFRSEDTDHARSTREFEEEIREGLDWLGLTTDSFSRQSERGAIYREQLEKIISEDKAYLSKEESKQEEGVMVEVIRLRNPNQPLTFHDEVRGDITFDTTELGDFVIARSLDDALYHFTVVVDDHLMGVTHVIRGEDHISNTPRQILIQEAIGASRPVYAHLPLILAPDRSKMSKRHGATSLLEYRKEGFLKEAILNYLALLGWNPGGEQEIYSLDELVGLFDLPHVQKGGAVFDREKFLWFNREHIKRIPDEQFVELIKEWLPEDTKNTANQDILERLLPVVRERISVLSDITKEVESGEFEFAFKEPAPSRELLKWKKDTDAHDALPRFEKVSELVATLSEYPSSDEVKSALMPYAEEVGKGEVLWPLRVALSGKEKSPDPFTIIAIIGREKALQRIKKAHDIIG